MLFVSDNVPQFAAALDWLRRKYGIRGIKILVYNSQANGSTLIPLDLVEATWHTEPPEGPLLTADLLGMHAKALAKHQQHVAEMHS